MGSVYRLGLLLPRVGYGRLSRPIGPAWVRVARALDVLRLAASLLRLAVGKPLLYLFYGDESSSCNGRCGGGVAAHGPLRNFDIGFTYRDLHRQTSRIKNHTQQPWSPLLFLRRYVIIQLDVVYGLLTAMVQIASPNVSPPLLLNLPLRHLR